ncbi:MAG: LysE family translocator [Neomegalonema sp.]|nr:LysE family translocator [Neomegalonema sp.]
MSQLLPMALFALTMSISPGPVNVLTLSTGLNHGPRRALPFVSGATVGFTLLLLLIGLGLAATADQMGPLFDVLALVGGALIMWFGYKLFRASGQLATEDAPVPSFLQGALLQWLNPKAWGACIAAVALFQLQASEARLYLFVAIYFVICFVGVGSWAVLGGRIRRWLNTAERQRWFTRALGAILILLAAGMSLQAVLG